MAELGATGSLREGFSTPVLLESFSRLSELTITDPLRRTWHAITGIVQHIDNRCDDDFPGSYPEGGIPGPELPGRSVTESVHTWRLYTEYLLPGNPRYPVYLPEQGFLTKQQRDAFIEMKDSLDNLSTKSSWLVDRTAVVHGITSWLVGAYSAKHAVETDDYLQARRDEGRAIGQLYAKAVPLNQQHSQFGRFERRAEQLGIAAKLADSVIDLPKDIKNNNARLARPRAARVVAALGATTEMAKVVAGRPTMVGRIGVKAALVVRNRRGAYNAERTHD